MESALGQLITFADPPDGEDVAFNAWQDEHAARRLGVPGFLSARRYIAVDNSSPRYQTCYDIEGPHVLQSPEYARLRSEAPVSEREILARVPLAERRVLKLLLATEPWSEEPPYQLTFAYEPQASVEEVVAWYRDEHIPLLVQINGWRRIRLYERVDGAGPRIVALHELESPAVFETDGYRHATTTPWREQIVGRASGIQRYLYKFLKIIQKP